LATTPSHRYCCRCCRNDGDKCIGSISFNIVRIGSALETTVVAAISSPVFSRTPDTQPSLIFIAATSALVRMVTPAAKTADAIAWVRAPAPPIGTIAGPTICGSSAQRSRNRWEVPGERGPALQPKTARAAIAALSNGSSNHSSRRSAIDIGTHRSKRYIFCRPSRRIICPILRPLIRSSFEGLSTSGGVFEARWRKSPPI
jgi:hypothetical protein